ncbi:MAG: hypothetical protein ABI644_05340 [Arenimonas sp.]
MKKIITLLLLALFQFGCPLTVAQTLPTADSHTELRLPEKDKAKIVFLKPIDGVFERAPVQISEIKNGGREFLGLIETKSKLVVNEDPGKHLFMSTMYNFSHFMDTDLVAGKRYYVLVRFVYARGFQLRPIRLDGPSDYSPENPEFRKWKSETPEISKTPATEKYFREQEKRAARSQEKFWKEWFAKTEAQRAELSLHQGDFIEISKR